LTCILFISLHHQLKSDKISQLCS